MVVFRSSSPDRIMEERKRRCLPYVVRMSFAGDLDFLLNVHLACKSCTDASSLAVGMLGRDSLVVVPPSLRVT